MKKSRRTGGTGPQNPGLELKTTRTTRPTQVSLVSSPVRTVPRWKFYSCGRWRRRTRTGVAVETRYRGLAEDEEDEEGQRDEADGKKQRRLNRILLDHFRDLKESDQDQDQVDLQYLDQLMSDGADPNSSDRFGQTVLHEISRSWSVDVMRFFLDRGSDLLLPDQFGVTALHVASALDYQDMVRFLLERRADPEARTLLDQQTPLHFASKNDSVGSIRLLLGGGASINATDYKHRTALQLAATLDRSEAARVLLDLGAEAGTRDSDGQLCITALIGQMSPVAQVALNQFHLTDKMTRHQYFYLNLLEPEPEPGPGPGPGPEPGPGPGPGPEAGQQLEGGVFNEPSSPLQVVVQEGKLDLIMNPVFLKLIQVKWELYGRLGAWLLLVLNFLFIVSWTIVAVSASVHRDSPERYVLPQDWWRVFFVVLALLLTLEEVLREVQDILRSRRRRGLWRRWAERRLHDDLHCAHPMWPQEKKFLLEKNNRIHRVRGSYSRDWWNLCDWLVYVLLATSSGVHAADVLRPSVHLQSLSLRFFSVTLVFLWLRLMKHVRAFRLMGPFIVMLGNIVGDVLRFLFLYAEIFVPYACSFWIMFGGSPSVPSMQSVSGLLFSLYRITLVDEYEYVAMATVDEVMAPLLCGTFLAASSILCVNLLVALLTDTFQRVHENSQANAVMQQASVILQVQDSMSLLRRFYDNQYISKRCSPLAEAYDHNDIIASPRYHDEMGRITAQIKETLDQFLILQRDREAEPGSGVQTDQNQETHNLDNNQKDQELQDQNQQDQGPQDQNRLNEELVAIRAELKELRTLVQQLVPTRDIPV